MANHKLLGRIFLKGKIETKSGLRIGGSTTALSIGGVDLPVIRDVLSNRPYIPGSSLKGKLRSLSEKFSGAPQNKYVGGPHIHVAENLQQYTDYWVNPIFGLPSEVKFNVPAPNRLIVRDIPLSDPSAEELLNARTDLPFTEVKWEVVVDRVTSKANPRQIERVPAGVVFEPMEMVFNVYRVDDDVDLFKALLNAMALLEDDYLGGHGSRGSGKIAFTNLSVSLRTGDAYQLVTDPRFGAEKLSTLSDLRNQTDDLSVWLRENLPQDGQAETES